MKKAKHTPGPWSNEYDGSLVMAGQVVCGCDHLSPDRADYEEAKANARLIAAAPELLEVAKAILKRFDLEDINTIFPGSALRDDLRKAIAKAEGR